LNGCPITQRSGCLQFACITSIGMLDELDASIESTGAISSISA